MLVQHLQKDSEWCDDIQNCPHVIASRQIFRIKRYKADIAPRRQFSTGRTASAFVLEFNDDHRLQRPGADHEIGDVAVHPGDIIGMTAGEKVRHWYTHEYMTLRQRCFQQMKNQRGRWFDERPRPDG